MFTVQVDHTPWADGSRQQAFDSYHPDPAGPARPGSDVNRHQSWVRFVRPSICSRHRCIRNASETLGL